MPPATGQLPHNLDHCLIGPKGEGEVRREILSRESNSHDQHRIPVAVEAVPLPDGFLVGALHQFATTEGRHENQQRRTGESGNGFVIRASTT